VDLRQALSECLESRFSSTYTSRVACWFSHAPVHPRSGLAPPEKAVLTIFFDRARKRKWRCGTPRLFFEIRVVRRRALEMSDLGSETSSTRGQNHPKTAVSLRCRWDKRREVSLQPQLRPACRKYAEMCRGREGMGLLLGRMWVRTAPVLPPWAPSLLQLPTWKSTGL